MAIKSGIAVGALPRYIGDSERGLVRLFDLGPDLVTHLWMLMHPDMQRTPRVRAFFDFVMSEVKAIRSLMSQKDPHDTSRI